MRAAAGDGALVVDKPAGCTSHDVVAIARRALGTRQIGHTGTLDPQATGVLVLLVNRATRLSQFLTRAAKGYEAVVRFGWATDTDDADGEPLGEPVAARPTAEAVASALPQFTGTFLQVPPPVSAKKIGGRRAYTLARGDGAVAPAPVDVSVTTLELTEFDGDSASLRLTSSAGFYVRALARDLGRAVGVPAHLARLRRTRSGRFTLDDAVGIETLVAEPARVRLVPLAELLPDWPAVHVTAGGVDKLGHGEAIGPADLVDPVPYAPATRVRLLDSAGSLVAVGEATARPCVLHPSIVLR